LRQQKIRTRITKRKGEGATKKLIGKWKKEKPEIATIEGEWVFRDSRERPRMPSPSDRKKHPMDSYDKAAHWVEKHIFSEDMEIEDFEAVLKSNFPGFWDMLFDHFVEFRGD